MPTGNFLILKRFIYILTLCAKKKEVSPLFLKSSNLTNKCLLFTKKINKMGYSNLAIALSPTLIRPKEATIETLISHGDMLSNLVSAIIEHYDYLFEVSFYL